MTFTLIETQELTDIHSTGYLYKHNATGAQVLHLDNTDENKAFAIAFKTPPYSDNGITHILEHSVLNGSEKYPSKEPFVELIKSSLNTFLNAMTYSDKTVYPVASTNDKDYLNLMSVYLDAVFKPNLIKDPQILAQEGWHYHLENKEDDLIYKGVVYNEMKGALGSPDRALYQAISEQLYGNSIYSHESGGDPVSIPELTQEEFVEYHEKYYHPSNSLTVVYGDIDQEVVFNQIASYFNNYDALEETTDFTFDLTVPENKDFQGTYSITDGDNPENKSYLGLGWHIGLADDNLDIIGMQVLNAVLFGNNDAPLKKALIEAEIGGDISAGVDEFGWPVAYVIEIQDANEEKLDTFKKVVKETLAELVKEGIDLELIIAALNRQKFALREAAISESNPRGVAYALTAFSTWLYDFSPFSNLSFNNYLDELTDKAQKGYFEKLIQEKLLNNKFNTSVTLIAEPGKNDRIEKERHAKLQEYKASLSDDELDQIIEETKALIVRQETPDKTEDLDKIPTLSREDLSRDIETVPFETTELFEGTKLFYSDQFTSEIDYVTFYFDLSDFEAEEFSQISLVSHLIGNLDTNNYSLSELRKAVNTYTGGIYASNVVFTSQDGEAKPYLYIRGKALYENSDKLLSLMTESFKEIVINDKSKVMSIAQSLKAELEDQINYGAHVLSSNYALSQFSPTHALKDRTDGIGYFYYIKEVLNQLQDGKEATVFEALNNTLKMLFNKARINVLYVGDGERVNLIKEKVNQLFADFELDSNLAKVTYQANPKESTAFITSQDVNYVAAATESELMADKKGSDSVLATILRYDYLWNTIRVKGGAYGSSFQHSRHGQVAMASYRDPNIVESLETYYQAGEYLNQLSLTEEEILKYIIGTLSPIVRPASAIDKGIQAFGRYQAGVTDDERLRIKHEILDTTEDELKDRAKFFANFKEIATQVVIGNKTQIDNLADKFDTIKELY
ncbi:insulinase family protein [Aerococcaceae bacterium DSM 111022]|nr:insulinase family protein [Aerococcaceae bacterium DSM 111022]